MNLTLSLSAQESAELERRAAAAGIDVKTFLLHVVHDLDASNEPSANDIPYDQWKQDFELWLRGHQTRNVNIDDSRESIYD
jgi:hypothetical protein